MVDLVLIHSGAVHGIYGSDLAKSLVAVEQPLWCRLIAGAMVNRGFSVDIIDAEAEHLATDEVVGRVNQISPQLVGIVVSGHQPSASSQQMAEAGKIASAIKANTVVPIAMMGNHPSALPERTLREESVDWVCDGEGPETLEGLLRKRPPRDIPGLVWWDEKRIIRCNRLAALLDLNVDFHGNVWHLLKMSSYRSHNWQRFGNLTKRQPYAAIYTSLGCSYKCSFCMINVFQHTNRYRMRDPKQVVDEMVFLNREYGVETFKFVDELFVLNRHHCAAICNGIIDAGLGDKISSWCYARVDTPLLGMLDLFRRAGFDWFALGIESGSKYVMDGVDKRLKNVEIAEVVRAIQAADINVIGNYIFGLPDDSMETMNATLALAMGLNTEFANFYCAQAYPGSPLYDEAITNHWKLPATWAGYSQHNAVARPLDTRHVHGAQVLKFRDEAFTTYFRNPKYQDMILRKFGPETLEHVRQMTKYRLKRDLVDAYFAPPERVSSH
jgi:radical SAM superfamily enzyme YgiQ (UPF0313 family)